MTKINISMSFASSKPTPQPIMRRIRKWGDPVMIQYGFDVNQVGTTNFQAVRCFNKETGFGAVTNYLYIPHNEVMQLRDMQFGEWKERDGKLVYFDEDSKMEWLCSFRGSLYMYDNETDEWPTASRIRWGTLTLGGNLVQVERYEIIRTIFGTNDDKSLRDVEMAKLVGFQHSDWSKPLTKLLETGLVHRVYCAYKNNQFGDSPKGIAYSPFYSPLDYDFGGSKQPNALYVPTVWLEPEGVP